MLAHGPRALVACMRSLWSCCHISSSRLRDAKAMATSSCTCTSRRYHQGRWTFAGHGMLGELAAETAARDLLEQLEQKLPQDAASADVERIMTKVSPRGCSCMVSIRPACIAANVWHCAQSWGALLLSGHVPARRHFDMPMKPLSACIR